MKRTKMIVAILATVLIVGSITPLSIQASEMEQSTLLYAPELVDESEFDFYTGPTAGVWSVNNGVVRIDGGNGNKAISKRQDFTDFMLEADITVEAQADMEDKSSAQGGLIFRASEGMDNVADGYHGYFFGLNVVNQEVVLGRSSGDNWHEIATKKMTLRYGEMYHVSIKVAGNHITCYVDDNGQNYAKIDVADDTHAAGGVGMRNWLSHVSFSNLTVSAYTEQSLSEEESYTNPVLETCADPDILYHNGTYFLYPTTPTTAGNDGIRVYTSTDLVNWTNQGMAFTKGDGWGTANFWAPDVIERDGIFYMYYVANEHICVATSKSPLGPFIQDVFEPMHSDVKEIDAHAFYDEASGKYYLYFVRFTDGNVIWGAELNDDMKTIKEETLTEIVKADQGWDQDLAKINEGPFMLVKDGTYYLTYSGSHFESANFGSGYATADSPLGPFTKYENNPIMKSHLLAHGTGHHCITTSPDKTEMFMVYHCHNDLTTTDPRKLCIDRIQFTADADGNTVLEVKGPTVTAQELPSGAVNVDNFIEFVNGDSIAVNVTRDITAEELRRIMPTEISIRTSKNNANPATIEWSLDTFAAGRPGEEVTVKGIVTLPEGVMNLGNSKLELDGRVIFTDSNPFADIQETEWYYPYASFTYENKLMNGKDATDDGLVIFDPANTITRAEFVRILYNKEGTPEVAYNDAFADVADGQWYTDAIIWAYKNEIVTGKGIYYFDVSGKITRQEIAQILYKYALYKKYDVSNGKNTDLTAFLDDEAVAGWGQDAMKWVVGYGVMKGKAEAEGNALAPDSNAIRAEAATMIKNFMMAYEGVEK